MVDLNSKHPVLPESPKKMKPATLVDDNLDTSLSVNLQTESKNLR